MEKAHWVNGEHNESPKSDYQVLEVDRGNYMGWVRMVAHRNGQVVL